MTAEIKIVTISEQRLFFANIAGDEKIVARGFGDELREHFNDDSTSEIIADISSFKGNKSFTDALIVYLALYGLEGVTISDQQIKFTNPQLRLV